MLCDYRSRLLRAIALKACIESDLVEVMIAIRTGCVAERSECRTVGLKLAEEPVFRVIVIAEHEEVVVEADEVGIGRDIGAEAEEGLSMCNFVEDVGVGVFCGGGGIGEIRSEGGRVSKE